LHLTQTYKLDFQREFEYKIADDARYPYFIEIRTEDGAAFYKKLNNRITLSKKRALNKSEYAAEKAQRAASVLYTHRAFTEDEEMLRKGALDNLTQMDTDE
jgi:Paf1